MHSHQQQHISSRSGCGVKQAEMLRRFSALRAPVLSCIGSHHTRPSPHLWCAAAGSSGSSSSSSSVISPSTSPSTPVTSRSSSSSSINGSDASNGGRSGASYRLPPPEIAQIVDAPPQPSLSYSPDRKLFLQMSRPSSLPPIYEIARPELKLAGLRVDPELYARSKMSYYLDIGILPSEVVVPAPPEMCRPVVGYPAGSWLNYVSWSPEGRYLAFTVRSPGGPNDPPRHPLALWVAEVGETAEARAAAKGPVQARQLLAAPTPQSGLNTLLDDYSWLDETTIVACVLPEGLQAPPKQPPTPPGPRVQDNTSAKKAQNRTWPDLLKNDYDVVMFEHYAHSEIVSIDVPSGQITKIGPKRMYVEVDVSPDGQFLMVSWLEPPYSFNVPCGRFPQRVQLWRRDGSLVRELAYLPLAEDIPIAFNSTRKGPRSINWRSDKPAELYWIEAQDGGDPAVEVSPRDVVFTLCAHEAAKEAATANSTQAGLGPDAANSGAQAAAGMGPASTNGSLSSCSAAAQGWQVQPQVLATTDLRCGGVSWCDEDLAILYESWWKTRRSVWHLISPGDRSKPKQVLFDRNYEDVYTDPGSPMSRRTKWGSYILAKLDGQRKLLMEGTGANPEGNRPFLDVLDLDTKETRRVWQSSPPYYEDLGSIMNDVEEGPIQLEGLQLSFSRETSKDPPQSYVMTLGADGTKLQERQVTNYPHPYPTLRDMQREVLRYPRADGVMLTATLYTPPGHSAERDGPLPCILWAYPREFKSKEAAGQMRRSPYQFASIGSTSPTLWLARGYAVLDGPTLPIVAEGDEEPNDTFIEQLVSGAKAAVEEGVRKGVVDPARVVVGGHSYGAAMAANLVAHSDIFAAAIARTGAYNRSLTPFGFQNEERTLWQAPALYERMSPFWAADKIKKPILLVHGEEDQNPGTFPLQSERLYQALKGHGAVCRLVLLPHEAHGYRAYESIMHVLYEQDQWLEKYAGFQRVDPDYYTDSTDVDA